MSDGDLSNLLIILASAISVLGIPGLLIYIYRLQKEYRKSVKAYQFEGADTLLDTVKEAHVKAKEELLKELTVAESKVRENVLEETRCRLAYLDSAMTALKTLKKLQIEQYRLVLASLDKKEGDYLNLFFAENNSHIFMKLEALIVGLQNSEGDLLTALQGGTRGD